MKRILFALACLAALTGGAGNVETGPVPTGQLKNPYEGDPQAIEYGAKLFKRISCHGCHGGNARGGTGPDLTDDEWLRTPTDEMIFNTIKNGRPGTMMSPFRDQLADEQIWYLVSFIRELGRKRKAEGS
ncbi:MAG TPA: c-type cytochrome [Burkholderiales bacterium]